jgi:preprotein translocase subunit SecA
MLRLVSKYFDSNDREVKKLQPIIDEINSLEKEMKKLKDTDFSKRTEKLKKEIASGKSVYSVLPEAFALVREAAFRTIGMRPYDVQMLAATVLAQGKVAEQKTGEGKTLSAVPALYLHALTGNTVHLVTVNDYLARRDAGWMGSVFHFLGMSVSSIINDASFVYDPEYSDDSVNDHRLSNLRSISRKEAYEQNIVYGINSEFGFDYLRDNMKFDMSELVQGEHYFAVVDEVDSVLIDEARTPHIISMPDSTPSNKYLEYAQVVEKLRADTDYKIDEKFRTAHLTDHGISKIESLFGIRDIYEKDFETVYHIEAALKAKTLYQRNKEYIVREGQVILVDEFTGRLLPGRRLSEGLHQALEAKEGVTVQQESKTLATVSLQNYFRMYEILAGMTGTAITEAEEFFKIYKLDVVTIPTNNPIQRQDLSDQIYKTVRAKYAAVVVEIEKAHKKGQPVLVGTTSIDKNEIIAELLKRKKIPHQVLNAKNHLQEALIISDAGREGAVTVATNMAGRGVDIILGGQAPSSFEVQYQGEKGKKKFEKEYATWKKAHDAVIKAGGLFVIGTEKHESRRIDNQLRGRSGRQGDPGSSLFILSLEDDLMRIFGGDQIAGMMTRFNFPEDQPLTHGLVTRVLVQAQVKVEGFNFESRKRTLDYDDVLNKQREIIYTRRRKILEGKENPTELMMQKVRAVIERSVAFNLDVNQDQGGYDKIVEDFITVINFDEQSQKQLLTSIEGKDAQSTIDFLYDVVEKIQIKRIEEFGKDNIDQIMKAIALQTSDNLWMDHLTAIEDLRTGIGLRGFAQRDPIVEYKKEAFSLFETLMTAIDDEIVHRAFRVNIQVQHNHAPHTHANEGITNQPEAEIGAEGVAKIKEKAKKVEQKHKLEASSQKIVTSSAAKIGRNDPCPCGSGLKYKKCHLSSGLA